MTEVTWTIPAGGSARRLHLEHQRLGGLWIVTVDGEPRLRERHLGGRGWRQQVDVAGQAVDVAGVRTQGGRYAYYALIDGDPVPSDAERAAGITAAALAREPGMGHRVYWDDLARESGLDYSAQPDGPFLMRHRLLGRLQGRLISVHLEQPFGSKVYVSLKAHVPPLDDTPGLKAKLLEDDRLEKLLGSRYNMSQRLGVAPAHIGVFLPYEPRYESAADLTGRIRAFARLVAAYTPPLPADWCAECQQTKPVLWGFMNAFPVQMCPACMDERLAWGESMRHRARVMTTRTGIGLLAGGIVALWGGLLWAIVTASFPADSIWPILLTLIAPVSLALAVRLTYTIARQPVAWFWLAAASFSLAGLVLADFVATNWLAVWARRGFAEDSLRNLPLYSLFAMVLVIWYGLRGWRNQRRHLAALMVPAIERVGPPPAQNRP